MSSTPSSRASRTLPTIDLPSGKTVRPLVMAASAICWTLWRWLAKHDAITLRPPTSEKILRRVSPTVVSDAECPGVSAFVESAISSRTPGPEPSAPSRPRSVRRLSTGV